MNKLKVHYPCFILLLMALCTLEPSLAQTTREIPLRPPLTSGKVQDNTYQNDSLGLQFAAPPDLRFSAPELKGKPGTLPLLVTVAAWGVGKGGAVFYADDLGYYPEDRRSTKAYVERVIRNQKKEGLDLVAGETEGHLGGVTFAFRFCGLARSGRPLQAFLQQKRKFYFFGRDSGGVIPATR